MILGLTNAATIRFSQVMDGGLHCGAAGMLRIMQIEVDVNAAGLLAQVIPALLILVALEERLSPEKITSSRWRDWLRQTREGSVAGGIFSLFLCLWVVVTKAPSAFTTWVVTLSTLLILVHLFLLFAGMFGRQDRESIAPEVDSLTGSREQR